MSSFKAHSVLPGFSLALGFTLLYLSLIVLIPLSALFFKTATLGWGGFWDVATDERVLASLRVTFLTAFAAAVVNAFIGCWWHGCWYATPFPASVSLMHW